MQHPQPWKQYGTDFQRILAIRFKFSNLNALIIDWASQGANSKDIAIELNLTTTSVVCRLNRSYKRLGLSGSRARLLLVGLRHSCGRLTEDDIRIETLRKAERGQVDELT